jgi:hypothetical protein
MAALFCFLKFIAIFRMANLSKKMVMVTNSIENLERIIKSGYEFRLSDYLSTGFNILKKNIGGFVVLTFVMLAVIVVVNFIPIVGNLATQLILSPVFAAAYYIVSHRIQEGNEPQFGDYTRGFDFVGQLALAAAAISLITLISLIPFFMSIPFSEFFDWYTEFLENPQTTTPPPYIKPVSLLLLIPAIYFGVVYYWTYLFIVFHRLSFWPAMEMSRKLITKKWFAFFGFFFVVGLMAVAGLIVFCIGFLASLPLIFCCNYAAFEDITKFRTSDNNESQLQSNELVE